MLPLLSDATLDVRRMPSLCEARLRRAFFLVSVCFGCDLYRLMQLLSSGAGLLFSKLAFGELFLKEPALRMLPQSSDATLVVGCMPSPFKARLRRAFLLMSPLFGCYLYRLTQLLSSSACLVFSKLDFGELCSEGACSSDDTFIV